MGKSSKWRITWLSGVLLVIMAGNNMKIFIAKLYALEM